ncbi:hypothetical protein BDV41DRAFT_398995 [Aspergillus transmontanensis]|uniref:Uncharacterized protein n=1 Tax=Aspergillus transmontanensis TaxID=1034304 RepID=A0A5N6VPQ8_9EURO|nr:hypothetical protein BDV41DRAFT_398995 [Aspergillus transmontanensis]
MTSTPFKRSLSSTMDSQPMFQDRSHSILVSVESVYSIDRDVCPLVEILEITQEIYPKGNFAFITDKAHATRIIGLKRRRSR